MASSDAQDQLQTALGMAYTLEREVGRGGMATVYLATDTKHHRPVALKVLDPELAASFGPERFRREIAIASKLQHPHILTVLDSGETPNGQLWFTMPYVEGESLRARLTRERQLALEDALRITREVANALEYAHQQGLIHRDIKPENILLSRSHALVADFGVARTLVASGSRAAGAGPTLTESGVALGTPIYMSPEQATGDRTLDARTDVYALGCVLYEMLAGEPPYSGATTQALLAKRVSGDIPSVRRIRPAVPPGVDAALTKSLAPVPADRYATAADFAQAMDVPTATAPASSPRPTGRFPVRTAVLGLGICIGAGLFFAWRHGERGAASAAEAGPVGLAVLPFDTDGDTANGYFADGITDEIRSKLSALSGLRLIAASSSNQYRHTPKSEDQISRELGVHYLLTGHIQWEQSASGMRRVRVSPELVEVRAGAVPETKWQQSYDTTLADVFEVQTAVATLVADKLGLVLSSPAQTQLAVRPTQNLAAYDAYLRSIALNGTDPLTFRRALAAAEQAVALDSSFAAAWARISRLHTGLYANTVPTRADADAARGAADRAIVLAPKEPGGYVARGAYSLIVQNDAVAARTALETALRLAPSSSEANGELALAEESSGRWAEALGHARQGAALDPRSADAAGRLSLVLLWLRRYPEARAEAERGLTFAPGDLGLISYRAISLLAEGDLSGARAGLQEIPPTLDRSALVADMASGWDLSWALDPSDRALVLTLPPSAFDNDRGSRGLTRAQLYSLAGDTAMARRCADSARVAYDTDLQGTPDAPMRQLQRGLALAYLGQRAAAVRDGENGFALAQATHDQYFNIPSAKLLLAQIYVRVGDDPHALNELESLLAKPNYMSAAWLRIDPTWASLRGNARFKRLLAQPPTIAVP